MIERPDRMAPNGFGKRGTVTMNRRLPAAAPVAVDEKPEDAAAGGVLGLPKWVIGGVAGAMLLLLVSTGGGFGGGGFLGGLFGSILANKLMNSGKTPNATVHGPGTAAAPRAMATAPAADSVTRGGFGTTASAPAAKTGGFSFGG